MVEPITLTLVGSTVLAEGIKFLYGQAGELLKVWRERKKGEVSATAETIQIPIMASPDIFDGTIAPLSANLERIEPLATTMRELWNRLSAYAQGIDDVETSNNELVTTADLLRRQLETVYGQRITFKGEPRERSGTLLVVGTADIERIAGVAAGVIAGTIEKGEVRGSVHAIDVESGGEAAGVKVDRIGG